MIDEPGNGVLKKSKLPTTDRSLPIALMRGREKVMVPIREMLATSGITEQQWRILRVLAEHGPLDASRLAHHACLLLPSQTRLVQTMLEKGLVIRSADDTDRRRQTISITCQGLAIIDENRAEAEKIASSFVDVLGKQKYEQLLDLLGELERL